MVKACGEIISLKILTVTHILRKCEFYYHKAKKQIQSFIWIQMGCLPNLLLLRGELTIFL